MSNSVGGGGGGNEANFGRSAVLSVETWLEPFLTNARVIRHRVGRGAKSPSEKSRFTRRGERGGEREVAFFIDVSTGNRPRRNIESQYRSDRKTYASRDDDDDIEYGVSGNCRDSSISMRREGATSIFRRTKFQRKK